VASAHELSNFDRAYRRTSRVAAARCRSARAERPSHLVTVEPV